MIRIVTDTASDILRHEAAAMNINIISLEITFEDGACPHETEQDIQRFYQRLIACKNLPITSRPSPAAYIKIIEEAKAAGDDVLILTLSSGLSGTWESAEQAKQMAEYDRVRVVDTHQAILTQRLLVEHAVRMRDEGKTLHEIADEIESMRDRVVVCGVVDTLVYLKKGGRIPASLAIIGEALHIKPVIVLEDKILKTMGKVRGRKQGVSLLYKRMEEDNFDRTGPVYFGYTSDKSIVETFMHETLDRYGLKNETIYPIGGIIGTHCGTSCIAVAYLKGN